MTAYLNLIGNQWLAAEDGATFAVDNPATEAQFATVSAASTAQVLQACDQAAAAQRWSVCAGHPPAQAGRRPGGAKWPNRAGTGPGNR